MNGYIPGVLAHGEGELPESRPGVRYKGSADVRRISLGDIRGDKGFRMGEFLEWSRANLYLVSWEEFLEVCGSMDRAKEFLSSNQHEFVVEDVDIDLEDEDEFDIGGVVTG